MIQVHRLIKNHGNLLVLAGVDLFIRRGEVSVIIGPSGGGKSTLLRCINGLEGFQDGEVRVDEICLRPRDAAGNGAKTLLQLRQRVGMVFQQFHLFPHMTVLANVLSGPLYVLRQPRGQAEAIAIQLLERVGLADKLSALPAQLSGGQQQRVAIARALAMKPQAILFDEPTSALDPRLAAEVLRVITDLAQSGQTMVVVTHAMEFARRVAHTVHFMMNGTIAESGPPAQIFEQPLREETKSFVTNLNA